MALVLPWPADAKGQGRVAREAARVLTRGGLVVFPTDTVYGLGADPSNPDAIRRIYRVKGRPDEKAIVWLVESIDVVDNTCHVDRAARKLARRFWPGPLTLILARVQPAEGGPLTLGIRVPAHTAALSVIRAVGGAVATTSANRSGEPSARTAAEVADHIGQEVDLIIDGGASPVGVESTVLDLTVEPPRILRPGALPAELLGDELDVDSASLLRPTRSP